jgi:hypothetical protein
MKCMLLWLTSVVTKKSQIEIYTKIASESRIKFDQNVFSSGKNKIDLITFFSIFLQKF